MQSVYFIELNPTKIAIADVVEITTMGDYYPTYLISRINVPAEFRQKGYGNRLMTEIMEDADKHGCRLEIHPWSSSEWSTKNLIKWYQNIGFELQQSGVLIRDPINR